MRCAHRTVSVYCTAMEKERRATSAPLPENFGGPELLKILIARHGKAALIGAGTVILLSTTSQADAYVGPGAGFALLGSFRG